MHHTNNNQHIITTLLPAAWFIIKNENAQHFLTFLSRVDYSSILFKFVFENAFLLTPIELRKLSRFIVVSICNWNFVQR
jgi:hypothetical protein